MNLALASWILARDEGATRVLTTKQNFDEFFESATLIQTGKIGKFPIVLVGKEFWGGLVEWLETRLIADKLISQRDLQLFHVTDDVEEAADLIDRHYKRRLRTGKDHKSNGREVP